uniref:Uncharacterized protein n=1 Tax=Ditylenchus dipsaci TaxID=166011 RepID=A0A915CT35_9BILA
MFVGLFSFYSTICYFIIIFCAKKMRNYINTSVTVDRKEEGKLSINKQITYTLLSQSIIPTIAVLIVFANLVICILLSDSKATTTNGLLSCVFIPMYWIAVLNPLSTIIVVKSYRSFFTKENSSRIFHVSSKSKNASLINA